MADANGRTIKQYPAYEQVFQSVFAANGKSVAYGVKDGNELIWKVEKLEGNSNKPSVTNKLKSKWTFFTNLP